MDLEPYLDLAQELEDKAQRIREYVEHSASRDLLNRKERYAHLRNTNSDLPFCNLFYVCGQITHQNYALKCLKALAEKRGDVLSEKIYQYFGEGSEEIYDYEGEFDLNLIMVQLLMSRTMDEESYLKYLTGKLSIAHHRLSGKKVFLSREKALETL